MCSKIWRTLAGVPLIRVSTRRCRVLLSGHCRVVCWGISGRTRRRTRSVFLRLHKIFARYTKTSVTIHRACCSAWVTTSLRTTTRTRPQPVERAALRLSEPVWTALGFSAGVVRSFREECWLEGFHMALSAPHLCQPSGDGGC